VGVRITRTAHRNVMLSSVDAYAFLLRSDKAGGQLRSAGY